MDSIEEMLRKENTPDTRSVVSTPPATSVEELVPSTEVTVIPKRVYRRQPTIKQIRALQYRNQGMTKRAAMKKAGYSPAAYNNPGATLMKSRGVKQILQSMAGDLEDAGLTAEFMAQKFQEWISAKKIHTSMTEPDREVPDYQTQLRAYKAWKDIVDAERGSGEDKKVKRKLTIEEYIQDGEKEQQ